MNYIYILVIYTAICSVYLYNTAVLINICRFLINFVKLSKPFSKLDLPTLRLSSVLPLRSVGRSNFDKGLHNLTTLIQKRHILMITTVLYNGINSGQL